MRRYAGFLSPIRATLWTSAHAKAIPAAWSAVLRRRDLLEDMADRLLAQAMVQLSDLP